MTATDTSTRATADDAPQPWIGGDWWYLGAVVFGSVLIIWAALNQPFNENELLQIAPYDGDSIAEITSGTRQPPLGPLLGGVLQHLLGEGQLQQRLVPVLSGIGTLVIMCLLLRSLRMGAGGAFALWVFATAPLMVRYSAYTRPYALPLFLMVLFAFGAQRWLESRRRSWLLVVAAGAVLLPLARVPEPSVFLGATSAVLGWLSRRGRLEWAATLPIIAVSLGSLLLVAYPLARTLASEASEYFDPSPSGIVARVDTGTWELLTGFLPLLADWVPWWPVTLLVVFGAVVIRDARRRLVACWFFWPLLAAPVAFALAYHYLNPHSFEVLPYRARAAYFFVVPYALAMAAVAASVFRTARWTRRGRALAAVLLSAALVGQLPATARTLLTNDAPDFDEAGYVLSAHAQGVVLYDRPAPAPQPRMDFLGKDRYLPQNGPTVLEVYRVAYRPRRVPPGVPIYILVNGQCAHSGRCAPMSSGTWAKPVPGWTVVSRFDRFTLYAPAGLHRGRAAAVKALTGLGNALGPELGYMETFAAAALLNLQDRTAQARGLIQNMYREAGPGVESRIRKMAGPRHLNPFVR